MRRQHWGGGSWSSIVSTGSLEKAETIIYLSMFRKNTRGDLGILLDQLEDRVGQDIRASGSKVHESLETRVRLAEDTMAVARDDTARLQGVPEVGTDVLVSELGSDLLLHGQDPPQDFLGSKAVQRSGKTQKTRTVAQEGVAQGASNQVGSVGGYVTALVVTVQSQIQTQQIVEVLVLLTTFAE